MSKIFLIPAVVATLILGSCKTSQMTSYNDDIYTNPADERALAKKQAEDQAKKNAEEKKQQEQAVAEQKAKDDANPYYQDPSYSKDDYYDYQYASRLNRFSNPIAGAGYYDNYYTNTYTYNQNPSNYGTSIYSSYNYGMPSNQFSSISLGISSGYYGSNIYGGGYNPYSSFGYSPYGYNSFGYSNGFGYSNFGYDPYGYNNYGYNNGFYNSYGAGYSNGYNAGYYSGASNGWGYYNSYDVNSAYSSSTNAPRVSNGGGNTGSGRTDGNSYSDNSREKLIESVNQQQNSTPRFSNTTNPVRVRAGENSPSESRGGYQQNTNTNNNGSTRVRGGNTVDPNQNNNTNSNRQQQQTQPQPQYNAPVERGNSGGGNGGTRGNSGGGGGRPR